MEALEVALAAAQTPWPQLAASATAALPGNRQRSATPKPPSARAGAVAAQLSGRCAKFLELAATQARPWDSELDAAVEAAAAACDALDACASFAAPGKEGVAEAARYALLRRLAGMKRWPEVWAQGGLLLDSLTVARGGQPDASMRHLPPPRARGEPVRDVVLASGVAANVLLAACEQGGSELASSVPLLSELHPWLRCVYLKRKRLYLYK